MVSDGQGHSYDLSPLALGTANWEAQHSTDDASKKFFINVCRSLVQMGGLCPCVSSVSSVSLGLSRLTAFMLPVSGSWACPSSAAACMKVGDEYVSLGHVQAAPTLDRNVLNLKYTGGQACPHSNATRTSIIRFQCDTVVRQTDGRPLR